MRIFSCDFYLDKATHCLKVIKLEVSKMRLKIIVKREAIIFYDAKEISSVIGNDELATFYQTYLKIFYHSFFDLRHLILKDLFQ